MAPQLPLSGVEKTGIPHRGIGPGPLHDLMWKIQAPPGADARRKDMTVPVEGAPWQSPATRYYDTWYATDQAQPATRRAQPVSARSDGELKSEAVDRLRANVRTAGSTLDVNVQAGVVVLAGDVPTVLAKRSAGDDCWDIPGVQDVSNQLRVVPGS